MVHPTKSPQFEPKYIIAAFGEYSGEAIKLSREYILFMRDKIKKTKDGFARCETSILLGIIYDMKETSMAVGVKEITDDCLKLEALVNGNDTATNIPLIKKLEIIPLIKKLESSVMLFEKIIFSKAHIANEPCH